MKIYINGNTGNESHEDSVEFSLKQGWIDAGGDLADLEIIRNTDTLANCMEIAKNNNGAFVHRSYTGAEANVGLADEYYPLVILSMPPGSNSPGEVFSLPIPQTMLVISSGDNGVNETSDNCEFVEKDPVTDESIDPIDKQSFASAYGLGKIAYIKHKLNCTIWEARNRAQKTGTENGVWDEVNGYGAINVQEAINYQGVIDEDPFLKIGSITANRTIGKQVIINIEKNKFYNSYEIYRNGSLIATITDTTYTDTLPDYGTYKYKYRGIGNVNSDYSDEVTVNYNSFDLILWMEEEMSFGFQVNTYNKSAEGSYGYTIKINLVDYNATKITFVQATNQPLDIEDPVTDEVSLTQLMSYLNDSDAPDLAYSFDGENLTVFFKESKFPYSDNDTRFAFGGVRNPQKIQEKTDNIDCSEEFIELVKLYTLSDLYDDKGKMVPHNIRRRIVELEQEIVNSET